MNKDIVYLNTSGFYQGYYQVYDPGNNKQLAKACIHTGSDEIGYSEFWGIGYRFVTQQSVKRFSI